MQTWHQLDAKYGRLLDEWSRLDRLPITKNRARRTRETQRRLHLLADQMIGR